MSTRSFPSNLKPFLKYTLVGILGTAIDIGSLYLFVEYGHLPIIPASVLSFLLAVINNFLLNKAWTFQIKSTNYRKLFVKFLIVSLVGLGLTIAFMSIFTNLLKIWYIIAKALTSAIVLIWNFLGNKIWTFKIKSIQIHIPTTFAYELSIVIPAYNEENRIKNTLLSIQDYLQEKSIDAEIIVVNDGSTDKTAAVIEKYQHDEHHKIKNLQLINLQKNSGKGFAVRKGIEASQGRLILFADADNSTPIEEYEKLAQALSNNKAQVAIGSRYLTDSQVKIRQPKYRILLGRTGNFLIKLFLIDGIKDTQCGFKLFEHAAAKSIFALQKVTRFGFDMESLVIANTLGYKITEVPVSWFNSAESRFRPIKDALITLKDLIYVKLNLWSGRYQA